MSEDELHDPLNARPSGSPGTSLRGAPVITSAPAPANPQDDLWKVGSGLQGPESPESPESPEDEGAWAAALEAAKSQTSGELPVDSPEDGEEQAWAAALEAAKSTTEGVVTEAEEEDEGDWSAALEAAKSTTAGSTEKSEEEGDWSAALEAARSQAGPVVDPDEAEWAAAMEAARSQTSGEVVGNDEEDWASAVEAAKSQPAVPVVEARRHAEESALPAAEPTPGLSSDLAPDSVEEAPAPPPVGGEPELASSPVVEDDPVEASAVEAAPPEPMTDAPSTEAYLSAGLEAQADLAAQSAVAPVAVEEPAAAPALPQAFPVEESLAEASVAPAPPRPAWEDVEAAAEALFVAHTETTDTPRLAAGDSASAVTDEEADVAAFVAGVDDFVAMIERGQSVEAIERYYAEHAQLQENATPPVVGKSAILHRERDNLSRARSVEAHADAVTYNPRRQVSMVHWVIRFEATNGYRALLDEIAMQDWAEGRIVRERFFYDKIVEE